MSRNRTFKSGLAGVLLALSCTSAMAADMEFKVRAASVTSARGFYAGVFGGGGVSNVDGISQLGTAFFVEAAGGPLSVNATGKSGNSASWLVGAQAGYEWAYGATLLPALEIEGLYLANTQRATLDNPTVRLPEHSFADTFPMRNAVLLANAVLGFRTSLQNVTPYIGVGLGAARVAIKGADSTQINPAEAGINHFNSGPDSTAWTFAAQAKAGVPVALTSSAYLFGEYRYLLIGANTQTFGPTVYDTHVPTSAWTVKLGDMSNHLAVGGVGVSF